MKFSKEDFKGETVTRLSVIIMTALSIPALTDFKDLLGAQKRKFNKELNKYINELPEDDWNEKIIKDFNEIVLADIFNEDFQPEKIFVVNENTVPILLLPDEEEKIEISV